MSYSNIPDYCPMCNAYNSFDVMDGQKYVADSKFSIGKGLVGTALFGPLGAIAGAGGKKTYNHIYTCKECGYQIDVHYSDNS